MSFLKQMGCKLRLLNSPCNHFLKQNKIKLIRTTSSNPLRKPLTNAEITTIQTVVFQYNAKQGSNKTKGTKCCMLSSPHIMQIETNYKHQ